MNNRIYVENLPAAMSPVDLIKLFSAYGNVVNVNIAADHNRPQTLGFGFVTMVTSEGARAAIEGLNGKQMASQQLIVTEVRPPTPGPAGAQSPAKSPGQYRPLNPNSKKNIIIPIIPAPDDGKAG